MTQIAILSSSALLFITLFGCTDHTGVQVNQNQESGKTKALKVQDTNSICSTHQGSLNGAVKLSERIVTNSVVKKVLSISVEGVEEAFNSSIVKIPDEDRYLVSFRFDCKSRTNIIDQSFTGVFELDSHLGPIGNAVELPLRKFVEKTTRLSTQAQDLRLFTTGSKVFALINDTPDGLTPGFESRRMYLGELSKDDGKWSLNDPILLTAPETKGKAVPEKNWVPFSYIGAPSDLLLGYWAYPLAIKKLGPIKNNESVVEPFSKCLKQQSVAWKSGTMRGGTPAVHISGGRYLSIFHSPERINDATTYHMGAYVFDAASGCITAITPAPITFDQMYDAPRGLNVRNLGGSVIFPGGLERFTDSDGKAALLVAAGVNDTHSIIMVLDFEKLLRSMVQVPSKRRPGT